MQGIGKGLCNIRISGKAAESSNDFMRRVNYDFPGSSPPSSVKICIGTRLFHVPGNCDYAGLCKWKRSIDCYRWQQMRLPNEWWGWEAVLRVIAQFFQSNPTGKIEKRNWKKYFFWWISLANFRSLAEQFSICLNVSSFSSRLWVALRLQGGFRWDIEGNDDDQTWEHQGGCSSIRVLQELHWR